MRSSVYSKHRGWKRLYSTDLSRDEQIRRGQEVESNKRLNRAHLGSECQLINKGRERVCDSFYCPRSMAQGCCLTRL